VTIVRYLPFTPTRRSERQAAGGAVEAKPWFGRQPSFRLRPRARSTPCDAEEKTVRAADFLGFDQGRDRLPPAKKPEHSRVSMRCVTSNGRSQGCRVCRRELHRRSVQAARTATA